jgi:hypothetical protein
LRGQTQAEPVDVEIYLKKHDGLILALNRIEFKSEGGLSVGHFKNLLLALIGEKAQELGIVKESSPGVYEAMEYNEFPKDVIDFLIFYKLLIILCKICIAKFDEGKIKIKMDKEQVKADNFKGKIESIKQKLANL